MHADVFHVILIGSYVAFSSESSQSFSEDENSQGVYSCDQHVDSEVKFQAFY